MVDIFGSARYLCPFNCWHYGTGKHDAIIRGSDGGRIRGGESPHCRSRRRVGIVGSNGINPPIVGGAEFQTIYVQARVRRRHGVRTVSGKSGVLRPMKHIITCS